MEWRSTNERGAWREEVVAAITKELYSDPSPVRAKVTKSLSVIGYPMNASSSVMDRSFVGSQNKKILLWSMSIAGGAARFGEHVKWLKRSVGGVTIAGLRLNRRRLERGWVQRGKIAAI
jgi:hypothetical protein